MKKKISGTHQYRRSLLHHLVPVAVWLAAVACVVGLLHRRAKRFQILGMAQGQIRQVAATSTGRLKSVSVDLFEPVKAGQTLAVVDTVLEDERLLEADLESRLAAASAEIKQLAAQLVVTQDTLVAERSDREVGRAADMRRFFVDVDNARLQILALRVQIESDRILFGDLESEVKITEDLLQQDAVAPYELERVKVQRDSLGRKIEENEHMLEQAESDLEEAKRRRDEFVRRQPEYPSVDSALEVIHQQIGVQEELMRGIQAQLGALKARGAVEIKSPMDGVVVPIQVQANEAIQRRSGEKMVLKPGEVVNAGDPILAVARTEPNGIIAYVPERLLGLVQAKGAVELVKSRDPAQIARSQVTYVGPTVELMPQRFWQNPNVPQWGRPVLIEVPPELELVPGEVVGIRGL